MFAYVNHESTMSPTLLRRKNEFEKAYSQLTKKQKSRYWYIFNVSPYYIALNFYSDNQRRERRTQH